jgi:Stage II sporulation protein E (SpoIIE)
MVSVAWRRRSASGQSLPRGEARIALASAGALYLTGAALISTTVLLPHVGSPAGAAAVGVVATLTALVLLAQAWRDRGGPTLAWAAEAWGVALIVALCASTGGPDSPFALIYFFALGHAAAFQTRRRFLAICLLGVLAFMAPLLYTHASEEFAAFACVGAVLALLATGALHVAVAHMREQRSRLEFVAQTLRRGLLPSALPETPGLQVDAHFQPLGAGSEVGGDFYDVFVDGGDVWLIVGDVCGKGAEAAVLTGFLRNTTAAYARDGASPAAVLARVNEAMLRQDFAGRFATAVLARLSRRESGVHATLAVAGHPPALHARGGGEVDELGTPGTLLGVFADAAIADVAATLHAGDAIVLYTDGLTEAHAPRLLTPERLLEQLRGPPSSPRDAIDALLELVRPGEPVRDDIAILAVRVDGESGR